MKIKHVLLAAVLMGSISATAKDYHYTTVPGDAMKARIYTLDNGLTVYMSVNKEKPRLQANIAVKTGSRNDPAETTGLAHYLEHLMFKGTQKFGTIDHAKEKPYLDEITRRYESYRKLTDPAQRKQAYHEIDSVSQLAAKYNIPNEYDKLMASIGSQGTNAYTSNDVTCYVENIPNNEIENWAKVQSDRFQNMVIRGFHTELEAVYEEKNISMASDNDKEFAALWKLLTPTHPYGTQTTIGEQEHLKNPSIINIQNYFHRYYVPNNVAICLAGDFDPDQTIAIIDKYFGSWKKSDNLTRPEFSLQPDITAVKDTAVVGKEAENVMLAWKFKGANDKESDVLDVIEDMLSNGKAGLMEVDLEQQMKLASAGAFVYGLHDYSAFILAGNPNKGQKLEEVRSLMLQEMAKLRRGEFDNDLLPSVIANKKLNFYRGLDSNDNRASIMVNGLNENLPAALRLTEEILHHAKADKTSWNQFIDLIEKQQQDAKTNQMSNFSYLWDYSTYGAYNPTRNAIKTADLRKMDPQELVNLLGGLNNIEHTVAYYGPYSEKQLNSLLAKEHKTAKKLAAVPEGKEYKMEEIKQNEIYIAPYDAKNIYLRSYQNTGKKSDVKDGALISLFNEYYGGGMNTIVFQELRETRGLAYNAGAAYYTPVRKDEKDYFMRHIITQNDKMMDCIHVFDEITDNLPQNEASFNLAKQNLMKSIQSRRVTKAGVINAYFNAKLRGIDYDVTKLYYEQLPSLTLQDITNFEKQNIVGKPYRMVILGDEKNLDMKSLEKIAPIKRLSQEEIFGY